MRQALPLAALAAVLLLAVPNASEAFGRRGRACPCPMVYPAPVWYYPPYCPPTVYWYPAQPGTPGSTSPAPPMPEAEPGPVKIKGKTYRIIPHPDRGDEREDERDLAAEAIPPGGAGSNIPPKE